MSVCLEGIYFARVVSVVEAKALVYEVWAVSKVSLWPCLLESEKLNSVPET